MDRENALREALLRDLERLHRLILRYAAGEEQVRRERDRLEESVKSSFGLWRALRDHRSAAQEPDSKGEAPQPG
ncbi:MAG: hypothetical protein QGI83_19005 [Candidatus Latescibacteria bacterium]|jgi:hypothetical protein|nr:hypothetical protein [Candidatus Latescibacterota bacterium]